MAALLAKTYGEALIGGHHDGRQSLFARELGGFDHFWCHLLPALANFDPACAFVCLIHAFGIRSMARPFQIAPHAHIGGLHTQRTAAGGATQHKRPFLVSRSCGFRMRALGNTVWQSRLRSSSFLQGSFVLQRGQLPCRTLGPHIADPYSLQQGVMPATWSFQRSWRLRNARALRAHARN